MYLPGTSVFRGTFRWVVLALTITLLGCANHIGVGEFVLYNNAFNESKQASNEIIDMLSVAEREVQRSAYEREHTLYSAHFDPDLASIFSDVGDPPLAARYRQSIAVIASYNTLMLSYANGEGFESLQGQAASLAESSLSLLETLQIAGEVSSIVGPYGDLFETLATSALEFRSRQVFRDELLASAPGVIELMQTMRDGSEDIFPNLVYKAENEIYLIEAGDASGNIPKLRNNIYEMRIILSNWVLLMDNNILALSSVIDAVNNPSSASQMASAVKSVSELNQTALVIQKQIAALAL